LAQANNPNHPRLLAVDDNADCSDLIVRTALKCGYDAFPVADARALDGTIRNLRPHVITLDLCLPDVDGIEIVSILKNSGFPGQLIIVSGQPDWLRLQAANLASMNGMKVIAHISKPVELAQLRELLMAVRTGLSTSSQLGSPGAAGDSAGHRP